MRRIFYLLFLLCVTSEIQAQIDNNFWFVAPEVAQSHGDRPIYVRISTMADTANILLRMPASLSFAPISQKINPNSSFSIDLTPWIDSIENKPADKVLNRGLLLTSDKNITAYYEVANPSNPAVSSFKGKNGLGTDFYISGQTDFPNQTNDGSEVFDIVATEDNTHVQITPSLMITGHPKGVTFEVILNKGQTYSARTSDVTALASLAGSHVVSDKPIAITIMDDSIITGGWDEIADQTIPVNILGWDYIVIKGFADNVAGNNDEHVFILAVKDNTDIYIDGNTIPITTLAQGSQYDYSIPPGNNTVKIKASNPVYVYHLSGHAGEAGSAIIPQDSCTGSRQVGFTRSTNQQFALLILTRSGNEGSFLLNGNNSIILASDFNVVPGSGGSWVYYRKNNIPVSQIPVGANQIVNTSGKFHLGILNMGSGGSSEYGYFSDFSSLYLGADKSYCPGDSLILDGGLDRSSYDWKKDSSGVWVTVDTSRFLIVHDSGSYAVMTDGDFCELRDTIFIGLYPRPVVNLGHDTTLCEGASITLDPGSFVSYRWQNEFVGRLYNTSSAGLYWVEVTNNNGCKAVDTIIIAVDSLPKTNGSIAGLSPVCQGQNGVAYSVNAFPFAGTYNWTIPAGSTGISTTNSITLDFGITAVSDTIRVKGHNACGFGPEVKLPVIVNPLPAAANPITGPGSICDGQSGTVYSILPVLNATSYVWTFPTGITIVSGNGTNSVTVNASMGSSSGNIMVLGTNTCGNGPSSSFPLTINPLPVPTITGPAAVCLNTTGTYTTEPGMTGYTWSIPAGETVISGGTATDATVTISWNTSGTETVSVNYTAGIGCTAAAPTIQTIIIKPSPVIANAGNSSICSNGTTNIPLLSNPPGSTYAWSATGSSPDVTGFSGSMGSVIIQTLQNSGFTTEVVTYTVTPTLNTCAGIPSDFLVSVYPVPNVNFTPDGQTICSGSSTSIGLKSDVAGTSYSWTASSTSGNLNGYGPGSGMTIAQVINNTGLTFDSVIYAVTPQANSCNGFPKGVAVKVHPLPQVTFTPCNDLITTTAAAPFPLKGGIPLGGTYSGTGITAGIFNPGLTGPGTFIQNYSYTNTWGCSALANHSITVLSAGPFNCGDVLIDPRDNKNYPTVKLGTQCWMAANLDYGSIVLAAQVQRDNCTPEKYCYQDIATNCTSSGGLYTWDEMMQYEETPSVQGFCPPGWHVPVENDWNTLFSQFIGNGFAGAPLKASGYSGFNALLDGARFKYKVWAMDNFATMIWSSTSYGPDKAWAHGLNDPDPSVSLYPASRSNAFVVRCIKN